MTRLSATVPPPGSSTSCAAGPSRVRSPSGGTAGTATRRRPRSRSPGRPASGWTPGIDYDPAEGGEFRTVPRQVDKDAPEAEPDEDALLREWDLDPAVWEVVSARKSLWQGGAGGTWLEARRVSFRKRAHGLSAAELDVEGIFSKYTRPCPSSRPRKSPHRIVMVPAGDLQLGKAEGGGTAATIERFCRITSDIQRLPRDSTQATRR